MDVQSILVPVDYSEPSREALRYAGVLAQALKAPVEVLHVSPAMPRPGLELKIKMPDGSVATVSELMHRNAEQEMSRFLAATPLPESVRVTPRILPGDPSRQILEALASGAYSFVVLGTCGAGAVQHWLLGSVADRVVRLSPVPVFTVGQTDTAQTAKRKRSDRQC